MGERLRSISFLKQLIIASIKTFEYIVRPVSGPFLFFFHLISAAKVPYK